MVVQKSKPIPDTEPLATLKQETLDHLDAVDAELKEAEKNLDALEELGIDSSRLRDKINWAAKARKIILEQFGPRG